MCVLGRNDNSIPPTHVKRTPTVVASPGEVRVGMRMLADMPIYGMYRERLPLGQIPMVLHGASSGSRQSETSNSCCPEGPELLVSRSRNKKANIAEAPLRGFLSWIVSPC